MDPVRKICFYVNRAKPRAEAELARLTRSAQTLGLEIGEDGAQVVVVLGGDGTMLSAVHRYPAVPLLGLNLGSLGFLAGVEVPRFEEALRALAAGEFEVSYRTALTVRGRVALNDVVVSRGVSGHAAVVELLVDGRVASDFFADGLVIATSTGSTAYSLSAGGPILMPDSQALVITPVCPHALTSRPLVVPETARLEVRLRRRPGADALEIFADGESLGELTDGESLKVERSAVGVPLVELPGYDPYVVLNRKLGWSGSHIG